MAERAREPIRRRRGEGLTTMGPRSHSPRGTDFTFAAGEHVLAATKVHAADGDRASVLYLHGLGPTAGRHGARYLLDDLARHGHASVTFEFSGNGESTGVLAGSCLRRRERETTTAAARLDSAEAPVLIGTSMGAHLAACAVPALRPRGLVLFCPAAYRADATDLRFDGSLTPPGCYPDSPAYAGIGYFDGDLLVVAARDDRVVAADVVRGYLDRARNARSVRVIWLDCGHFIHRWLPAQPAARAEVHQAVLDVVSARSVTTTKETTADVL
jgi:pimeloyl-ACP methyl ester carboxylesterase